MIILPMGTSSKFPISQRTSKLNPKATRNFLSSQACSNYYTFEVVRSLVTNKALENVFTDKMAKEASQYPYLPSWLLQC